MVQGSLLGTLFTDAEVVRIFGNRPIGPKIPTACRFVEPRRVSDRDDRVARGLTAEGSHKFPATASIDKPQASSAPPHLE